MIKDLRMRFMCTGILISMGYLVHTVDLFFYTVAIEETALKFKLLAS